MEIKARCQQTDAGVIPFDWSISSFERVFKRLNTKRYQIQSSDYQESGDFPIIDQSDVLVAGFTDQTNKVFHCPKQGVIIFGDHTCVVKFVNFDFAIGADGTQLLVAQENQSSQFYAFQLQYHGIPTTGYNRHFKFLKERLFITPNYEEQCAIAEVLSDTDKLLNSLDRLIAKKRDLKQAAMQLLLTGKIRLHGFSTILKSGSLKDLSLKKNKNDLKKETNLVTFLSMGDISENGTILYQRIIPLSLIKEGLTYFEKNNILIAKITPCFENGKGAFLGSLKTQHGYGSTEFHVLCAKSDSHPQYIYYQTRMPEFREKLEKEMIGTAGQKRVPISAILGYRLPVIHSKTEQTAIAEILSDMDAELAALEQRREKTLALKQGMMQELLTGKTRLL